MFHPNSIAPRNFYYFVLLWIYVFHITFLQSNEASIERKFTVRSCRDNNCSKALELCIQDRCNTVAQCQYCIDRYNPECTECSNDIFNEKPEIIDDREVYVCDIEDDVQVVACRYFCRGKFRSNGECVPYSNNLDVCDCSANPVTATSNPTTKPTSPIFSTLTQTSTEPASTTTPIRTTTRQATATSRIETTAATRDRLLRTFGPHRNQIWSLQLLSNGFIAAGDNSGDIRIWNPNNGELIRVLDGHTDAVYGLKLLSNGNLASSADDKKIIIWNVTNGNIVKSIENSFITSSLETLLDDKLVAGGADGNIRLFDKDLSLITTYNSHLLKVVSLKLLPNGNLASCSIDTIVKIWDTANNFAMVSRGTHSGPAFGLDLIGDGNLVSGGWDRRIKTWNYENGKLISDNKGIDADINAVRYVDNNLLAVSGETNRITIFDTNNWRQRLTLTSNTTQWTTSLELLSNGNLISGSADGLLRVWQL